ncbi:MAG: MarR family transcriptional regulator [Pseudomonadota bacterium]
MTDHHDNPEDARALALAAELRALISKMKRRFRSQVHMGNLTMSQVAVLSHLDRNGPMTVTNLAKAEGMRPQSMGAIVASLEAVGHVSGSPDPKDGRQTILSLTPSCLTWIAEARAARQDWLLQTIEKQLTPSEQDELARAVKLLTRIVES